MLRSRRKRIAARRERASLKYSFQVEQEPLDKQRSRPSAGLSGAVVGGRGGDRVGREEGPRLLIQRSTLAVHDIEDLRDFGCALGSAQATPVSAPKATSTNATVFIQSTRFIGVLLALLGRLNRI